MRLALLLDTLGGAVTGLRRELGARAAEPARARPTWWPGRRPRAAGSAVDGRAALDALLAVPSAHLIVDGYNVSKTGYPELPLADQRTRLVGQLAALAAQTGVEITVVFDGAGVVTAPDRGSRGVRVLFSDAGVLADDVIRELVAVEPAGSADRRGHLGPGGGRPRCGGAGRTRCLRGAARAAGPRLTAAAGGRATVPGRAAAAPATPSGVAAVRRTETVGGRS